jgi:hypothetical protein
MTDQNKLDEIGLICKNCLDSAHHLRLSTNVLTREEHVKYVNKVIRELNRIKYLIYNQTEENGT